MSSQFFGLEIAHTGLTAFMASINTTANNVSNAKTKGYSRQKVTLEAQTALRVYQKYGSTSTGVLATDVKRSRDEYYDQKYWANQKSYGYYDRLNYYMPQIENFYVDNSANPGFSTLFGNMFNSIDSLKKDAGNTAIRTEVASNAEKLTDFFNSTANQLSELQETVNDEIKSTVDQVNAISKKIALLNKQINIIELQGMTANDLRDSRDLLVDELSQIIPIDVSEAEIVNSNYPDMKTGATSFTIKVNGNILVKDKDYRELECVTRGQKYNQDDIDGLYDIRWKTTQATFELNGDNADGRLKALFMIRDGNDEENFKGRIISDGSNTTTVKMENTYGMTIDNLNLPESGQLTIDYTNYDYSSFNFETDREGNILSITFNMTTPIDAAKIAKAGGTTATVGQTVNYKGIPYYQNQMNSFLRSFAKAFNDIQMAGADRNGNAGTNFFCANDINGENDFDWNVTADLVKGKDKDTSGNQLKDTNGNLLYAVDDAKYDAVTNVTYNANGTVQDITRTNGSGDNTYYRLTASNVGISEAVKRDASRISTTSYYDMADKWDGKDPHDATDADASVYKLQEKKDANGNTVKDANGNIVYERVHQNKGIDAADLVDKLLSLESDKKLFRGGGADDFLQVIYADITVDTQEASIFNDNYTNIQKEINTQRQSVSGVDEDEEALNLVKFQNAYNLSAKVISTLAEMYDQLILNTGV